MAGTREYYVYQLIDPRTAKPFYVGKGKNGRINDHEKEARRGSVHPKCDVIRAIEAEGLTVIKKEVKRFSNEDDAYNFEKKLIANIGLSSLTNLSIGGRFAYPVKPRDKELELDKLRLDALLYLYKKTDRHTPRVITWCGQSIPLDKDFFSKMDKQIRKIARKRGVDFVNKIAKKYKIIMQVSSKVDSHVSA